jgi:hypothetical protein
MRCIYAAYICSYKFMNSRYHAVYICGLYMFLQLYEQYISHFITQATERFRKPNYIIQKQTYFKLHIGPKHNLYVNFTCIHMRMVTNAETCSAFSLI